MITVVGLGNQKNEITLKGIEIIQNSDYVYLKTALTETVNYFNENAINYTSFDSIYENADDFNTLDEEIVIELMKNSRKKVCFCVNGSGYDDRSVELLSEKAKIQIVPSVSLGSIHKKPSTSFIQMSAYDLVNLNGFNYDTRIPLLIVDIDNKYIASELKLVLSNILGDDQEIMFNNKSIKILEIDRQHQYNYKTNIYIDSLDVTKKERFNFSDLYCIMTILRSDNGCEWDKAQTHESIRENVIEEAYELVDAINNYDIENMIEESGDLMLQSIFHCVIGESSGEYNVEDAISSLCHKLIFRHPHIFGDIKANNKEEALKAWENAKAKEKQYSTAASKIEKIAKALPALMKAQKVQSIVKKSKLVDINENQLSLDVEEAFKELPTQEDKESLCGEILLKVVSILQLNGINPEVALSKSLDKYINKFEYVEKILSEEKELNDEKIKKAWEEAEHAN